MSALPVLIPVPLLFCAFLSVLVGIWRQTWAYIMAMVGVTVSLAAAGTGLISVLEKGELRHYLGGWPPPFGIEYVLDPLSAFMAVVVGFIGFIVMIYPPKAGLYRTPQRGIPMYAVILLLLGGLQGVVVI